MGANGLSLHELVLMRDAVIANGSDCRARGTGDIADERRELPVTRDRDRVSVAICSNVPGGGAHELESLRELQAIGF
jgi:hypothetical protein